MFFEEPEGVMRGSVPAGPPSLCRFNWLKQCLEVEGPPRQSAIEHQCLGKDTRGLFVSFGTELGLKARASAAFAGGSPDRS